MTRLRRIVLALAAVSLLLCGCQKNGIDVLPELEEETVVTQDGLELRPSTLEKGHLRLKLSDDMTRLAETDPEAFSKLFGNIGAKSVERTFPDAGKFEARSRKEGLHRWYDLYFDEEMPLTKAGEELSLIENLGYVEYRPKIEHIRSQDVSWRSGSQAPENYVVKASKATTFNDPYLSRQWHYYNTGDWRGSKSGCDVNVVPVWNKGVTGREDVIVAVVDGGIDFRHEDLAANMWHNPEVSGDSVYGFNFVRNNYKIEPEDHGTHVSGTIAAVNNNGIGVCGIAGGDAKTGQPGVKLMSCQIFLPTSSLRSGNSAAAIKWGADHGAVISQNSWGYLDGSKTIAKSDQEAVDYFNKYAGVDENGTQTGPMKGGVVFFAAGNEHRNYGAPASYEGCVAVGAVDARYNATGYTNYGDWVDVAAPGGDSDYGPTILSTWTNNDYGFYEGTSMACPHVSGVAALVVSELGGPGFTREMLVERITSYTTDLSKYGTTEIGDLVNAFMAVYSSGSKVAPDSVADYSLSVVSNRIHFKLKIPEDEDDGTPYCITAWYDTLAFSSPDQSMFMTYELEGFKAGDWFEGDIDGLDFEREYYVAFDAYDISGNHSALSLISTVTTGRNTAPVIKSAKPLDNVVVNYLETKELNFTYYDPDGHEVTTEFHDNSGAATITDDSQGKCVVRISGPKAPEGNYEFKLIVTDRYGAADSVVVPYRIKPNTPPQKKKDIANFVIDLLSEKPTLSLADYFYDDDGETLAVKCTVSDKSIVRVEPAESNRIIFTPITQGTASVTVEVSDSMGEKVSTSFKVLIRNTTIPFDVYPNPVTDGKLYIRGNGTSSARVVVSGVSGAPVYEDTVTVGAFEPAMIDLSGCGAGVYSVKVSNSDGSMTTSIVKI